MRVRGEGRGVQGMFWFWHLLIWTRSPFESAQDFFKDEDRYDAKEAR